MQLIKKIEINYLRSIYSATLDRVGDLNIFFGRNDAGKSNILRGLNLFFNEESDPGQEFLFDIDMSDARKRKAAEAKGKQFVWIKITFNVPENYRKALGDEVSVKRQWNRDGIINETSSPHFSGGKAGRLSRLLNEIDFTYIPAIKDITVYADLIERMYSSASEDTAMLAATNKFISAIGSQTETLTEQLSRIFGGRTILAPPTDMATLFRSLDFSHGEEGHSLFKQKGDGVKARHLPEILRFINLNSPKKKFYIWGFEEPENSLDLSAAAAEAKRLAMFSGRADTQVFVSSHSPAFYLAPAEENSSVRRFFVSKQTLDKEGEVTPAKATSDIDTIEDADQAMRDAGLLQLPYIIRQMKEAQDALQEARENADALRRQIESLARPTLFVEGAHDVKYYQKLLSFFGIHEGYGIKELQGTPKTTSAVFESITLSGGFASSAKTLFLFDNDHAGRSSVKQLCSKSPDLSGQTFNQVGENVSIGVIPCNRPEFEKFYKESGIPEDRLKFPFELLFVDEAVLSLIGKLTVGDEIWRGSIHDDYHRISQKVGNKLREYEPGTRGWLYARMVPENFKEKYLAKAFENISTEDTFLRSFVSKIETALGLTPD